VQAESLSPAHPRRRQQQAGGEHAVTGHVVEEGCADRADLGQLGPSHDVLKWGESVEG